jgi:hypothetical protein
MNGLLVVVTLANSVLIAWSVIEGGLLSAWWQFAEQSIRATALTISLLALMPGIVVLTFSLLSRRPRGCVIGGSSVVFLAALFLSIGYAGASDDALAVVLLVVRLVTLASTLAGLLLNRGTVPVQWATFQRRNRTTFLVSAGTLVVGTSMVAALNAGLPAVPEQSSTAFTLVVEAAMVIGLYGGGPVLLGAAYFAGVRLIPLGAGAMIIFFGIDAAFTSTVGPGLLFCPAALLVLAAFYWQLRRTAERPPPDFWETRWREWKWPLAVLAVAGTMLVAWLASEEWSVTLACGAVPAVIALLTLAHDLATDHLAGFVQRHRLGARIPLHFD